MQWERTTQMKFNSVILRMPVFHRHIAQEAITKKAEENARLRSAVQVEEQDVVGAFFSDVPNPFYSMMVRLLDQAGFEYRKYGFPKQ